MPRRKPVPEKQPEKKSALQSEVTYLVTAAVGVLLLLVLAVYIFSEEPTAVIRFLSGLLFGLFGYGAFFLPVGILAYAVCKLAMRDFELPLVKITAVFWLGLSLLHIIIFTRGVGNIFGDVYAAGLDSGGGVFGLLIGGLLYWITGYRIIVGFVLISAIIILLVLITGRSFVSLVGGGVKKDRDFYEETKNEEPVFAEDDEFYEEVLPPMPPLPPLSESKKGNFVDIEVDHSPPPPKIRLVNEELDEGFSQRKGSLFEPRREFSVESGRNPAVVAFPAEIDTAEPDPEDYPPWEEIPEDMLEDYYDDEPVVLSLDVRVYGEEPVVRGLVEGAEKAGPLFEDAEDEDSVGESRSPITLETYENFNLPEMSLLARNDKPSMSAESRTQVLENSRILEETLRSFKIEARVVEVSVGPTVTRYDLAPGAGVKVSSITNLNNDLALALAAQGLRIEAPVPGRSAIGIEIPNKESQGVFLREILEDERFVNFPSKLSFAVGKDITGSPIITDVAKMPHLLIAGATGSGKSVCINTLIVSILYKSRPDEVKLLMIDPKVVELSVYNGIPHLLIPVVTDPKKASGALSWAVAEMEKRYTIFAEAGCRDIRSYNASPHYENLPLIVVIIDELADLMMSCKGEVEESICRLAQKARAAGIHLIVATQRPSVDVITGLIKANIPSRLAFAVSSGIDSRTVLDMYGAEKLLGKGDMLFLPMGQNKPLRVQGGFISEGEVENIVNFLRAQAPVEHTIEEIQAITMPGKTVIEGEVDEFFYDAVDFLISKGKGSTSMLQRQFRIGYNRASRLMDDLQARGIVGPEDGVKPRKVTISREEFRELYGEE